MRSELMEILLQLIELLRVYWLSALLLVFLLAMLLYGWKRGLVRMSFSLVSFVCSALLSRLLLPYAATSLGKNRMLTAWLQRRLALYLRPGAEEELQQAKDTAMESLYRLLGLDRLAEYAADRISSLLLSLILFLAFLLLSRILLRFLFALLDRLMRLPMLNQLNRSSGALLGLIEGIFYIWVFIIVLGLLPEYKLTEVLAEQFAVEGTLACYLRDTNLILYFFRTIFIV